MAEKEPRAKDAFLSRQDARFHIPACTPEEKRIRNLPIEFEHFLARDTWRAEWQDLTKLRGSVALRKIDTLVASFAVKILREEKHIPKSLLEKAAKVITLREQSTVTKGGTEHFVMRELAMRVSRLTFNLVAMWVSRASETGFNEIARAEYESLTPAMAALDILYLKLVTEPSPVTSDQRVTLGKTKEYHVIRKRGNTLREVPLHIEYSRETKAIVTSYKTLISRLKGLKKTLNEVTGSYSSTDALDRKIRYYEAVQRAFETSDAKDWLKADTLLPQQIVDNQEVIHVHPIEVGYMKDRVMREPEISLRAPDMEARRTQKIMAETKSRMLRSMKHSFFSGIPTMTSSAELVAKSNAGVRHFLGAGSEALEMRPVGQVLPNEIQTRMKGGVDASLDLGTYRERQALLNESFIDIFGQEAFTQIYEPRINLENELGMLIASHEFSHAIGANDSTEKQLGRTLVSPYVEEWKATAGGLVCNYWIPYLEGRSDEISTETLRSAMLSLIAQCGRYSANRGSDSAKAYYRQSIMIMKVAEECGAVSKSGDEKNPWKLNVSDEVVIKYFQAVAAQYKELLTIYASGRRKNLKEFIRTHMKPSESIEYMAAVVDAKSPNVKNPTPSECARLPA